MNKLDTQEYYELMQEYRHAPLEDQYLVGEKFDNVKKFLEPDLTTEDLSVVCKYTNIGGSYETDCGNEFKPTSPNSMSFFYKFCPYCGKHLEIINE